MSKFCVFLLGSIFSLPLTGIEVISEIVFHIVVILVSQQRLSETEDLSNSFFLQPFSQTEEEKRVEVCRNCLNVCHTVVEQTCGHVDFIHINHRWKSPQALCHMIQPV